MELLFLVWVMVRVIFSVLLGIFSFFIKNIIIAENLTISIIGGIFAHHIWNIHAAICLLLGIILFFILTAIHTTKIGFYILSGIMTLAWACGIAFFFYDTSHKDIIWTIVGFIIGLIVISLLHYQAGMEINADTSDEEMQEMI